MPSPNDTDWMRLTMEQFGHQLTKLQEGVSDCRERLIKLEASSLHVTVETVQAQVVAAMVRIDNLEATRDAKAGSARSLSIAADWSHKLAPWAFATVIVVAEYFTRK